MNFITNKHLSRRTFLRGSGVTLALPFLESMLPAQTPSTAVTPKTRLTFIFYPHGVTMDKWLPATTGTGFEFTPILKPLEPYRDYITACNALRHLWRAIQVARAHAAPLDPDSEETT